MTNGINIEDVTKALFGRLGWASPFGDTTIGDNPTIDVPNLESKSGRYFQSFHPLCTPFNIKQCYFENLDDVQFNLLLEQIQKDAIVRCITSVFTDIELIQQVRLFDRYSGNDQKQTNNGSFIGYEINISKDYGLSTQINGVFIHLDKESTFNMYLFKDGQSEPIKTIPVTSKEDKEIYVPFEDVILSYSDGYRYFIGYFQNDIGDAEAYIEQISNCSKTLCFSADPIIAKADGVTFDKKNIGYTSLPYGINLDLSTFRDYTSTVINNASKFDEAIGLTVCVAALEIMLNSTNSNATERITKDLTKSIFSDLNQMPVEGVPVVPGLKSRLNGEFKKLRLNFTKQKPNAIC